MKAWARGRLLYPWLMAGFALGFGCHDSDAAPSDGEGTATTTDASDAGSTEASGNGAAEASGPDAGETSASGPQSTTGSQTESTTGAAAEDTTGSQTGDSAGTDMLHGEILDEGRVVGDNANTLLNEQTGLLSDLQRDDLILTWVYMYDACASDPDDPSAGANTLTIPEVSGSAGLTFELIASEANDGDNECRRISVFRAQDQDADPPDQVLNIAITNGDNFEYVFYRTLKYSGADTSGAAGSGAIGQVHTVNGSGTDGGTLASFPFSGALPESSLIHYSAIARACEAKTEADDEELFGGVDGAAPVEGTDCANAADPIEFNPTQSYACAANHPECQNTYQPPSQRLPMMWRAAQKHLDAAPDSPVASLRFETCDNSTEAHFIGIAFEVRGSSPSG